MTWVRRLFGRTGNKTKVVATDSRQAEGGNMPTPPPPRVPAKRGCDFCGRDILPSEITIIPIRHTAGCGKERI
jgi:hypothetical protein